MTFFDAAALDTVDMKTAARARGVVYEVFRKRWRAYVRLEGFPAPVSSTAPYRWRPQPLLDWQTRREAENRATLLRPPEPDRPANQNQAEPRAPVRTADRQRNAVLALMTGG
ncbi:hypothetical protein [Brevundimonas sp.]|uniref:hypothetical protein n=1 Tax=Brevundimonas sp. TaxID=1871086 RepID=UPI0028A283E1|nr:hypothetical protein [Brevundimonas sp.]